MYNSTKSWRILNDAIQSAITGEKTPAKALADGQRDADADLKRFW